MADRGCQEVRSFNWIRVLGLWALAEGVAISTASYIHHVDYASGLGGALIGLGTLLLSAEAKPTKLTRTQRFIRALEGDGNDNTVTEQAGEVDVIEVLRDCKEHFVGFAIIDAAISHLESTRKREAELVDYILRWEQWERIEEQSPRLKRLVELARTIRGGKGWGV